MHALPRWDSFGQLRVHTPRHFRSQLWLEEAPESEARLTMLRWSARSHIRACAVTLASASRRLRRLLIETVRVASWQDLSPAIGDDPALIEQLQLQVLPRRGIHARADEIMMTIGAQLIESNVVARAKRVASVVHATVLS